jgi:hypothetical protein
MSVEGNCLEQKTILSDEQRAAIVRLGEEVGLRIKPTSIQSIEQAERVMRQLKLLRASGMGSVLSGARQRI